MKIKFNYLFEIFNRKNKNENFNSFIKDLLLFLQNYAKLKNAKESTITIDSVEILDNKIILDYSKFIESFSSVCNFIAPSKNNLINKKLIDKIVPFNAIKSSDPRLSFLSVLLALLLELIDLYNERGDEIKPKYFSLKKLERWKMNSSCRPDSLYGQLARTCNANCTFCYIKSNPPNIAIAESPYGIGKEEFKLLMQYFSPQKKEELFSLQYQFKEIFTDEFEFSNLKKIREKSSAPFFIVTNGIGLTEEIVRAIKEIEPAVFVISFNTFSKKEYQKIMNKRTIPPAELIKRMEWFDKYQVSYIPSLIASPEIVNLNCDILNTLRIIDRYNPVCTRINLFGYTDLSINKIKAKCGQNFYDSILELYHNRIIGKFSYPIFLIPIYRYLNKYSKESWSPLVLGTIKNSPSYGKIKTGDIIKKIDNIQIEDCQQFKQLSTLIKNNTFCIEIERESKKINFKITKESNKYPYNGDFYGKYHFPFGIITADGLNRRFILKEINRALSKYKAKNVLLITSMLMKKPIINLFKENGYSFDKECLRKSNVNFHILVPYNYYFGGNIDILDMVIISDIIKSIGSKKDILDKIDLVIMPSSFLNEGGFDLVGISSKILEKATHKPIVFIKNHRITF